MSERPNFKRIARKQAADEAIDAIKEMILHSELTAGQRLPSERELAELLGLSRPTVREAVRALIALNILESRHGEGTFVTSLEPELLAEPIDFVLRVDDAVLDSLFEARRVIETGATALAATRITPEEVDSLHSLVRIYEASLPDAEDCIAADTEFHSGILKAARNPILSSMLGSLSALLRESRDKTARDLQRRTETIPLLDAIVAALRNNNPDEAREAMAAHLDHVAQAVDIANASTQAEEAAK